LNSQSEALTPLAALFEHLEGVEKRSNGWWALCPAHDDTNPSLHVEEKVGGHVVYICRAGCNQQSVTLALEERGFKKRDLFPKDVISINGRSGEAKSAPNERERLMASYHT
jgi:DNA primase